jgi:hypothetical protein
MNAFLLYFLIGLGAGLPLFMVGLLVYKLIKNTLERRKVKKEISKGNFLIPIDTKDYDSNAWKEKIDSTTSKEDIENLNKKLFKKELYTVDYEFLLKAVNYLTEAKKIGYTDEQIKKDFKSKSYSEELINKIFDYGRNTNPENY